MSSRFYDAVDWFYARTFTELLAWGFAALLFVMAALAVKSL